MTTLYLDIEVFNSRDIKDIGSFEHTRTGELLLITWALDDGPVQLCGPRNRWQFVSDWHAADIAISFGAYDRLGLMHLLGLERPLEQWRCCMAKAYSVGLPGRLDHACRWLGLAGKLQKSNMLKFSRPRKPTQDNPDTRWTPENDPYGYAQFKAYAVRDTESMRAVWKALPGWNYDSVELARWQMDQRMNDRGLPIDTAAAAGAVAIATPEEAQLNAQFKKLTGLNLTQRDKVKTWLAERGVILPDLRRDTVDAIDLDAIDPKARRAIELRLRAGRATVSKFRKLLTIAPDGVARHQFAFNGAQRTLRWAGRDIQPQNMLRPLHKLDPRAVAEALATPGMDGELLDTLFGDGVIPLLDIVSSGIRGTVQAPPGHMFTVGDLAQIEARVVLWLAGQWDILEAFEDPERDPYIEMSRKVGSTDRQLGKVLVLACGFGMGADRFQETARDVYGLQLSPEEAKLYVDTWREVNGEVVKLWRTIGSAVRDALTGRDHIIKVAGGEASLRFEEIIVSGWQPITTIQVPSGHRLCYWDAHIDPASQNVVVRDPRSGWKNAWGGFFVENLVQSIARHVICEGMERVDEWLPLVGTVHDEAIGVCKTGAVDIARMERDLTVRPSWAPSLPLAAEVYATQRYTK
jgi:DNA polymerase